MNYRHTQIGYLIIFVFFLAILYFGILFTHAGLNPKVVFIIIPIFFILIFFVTLNVMIDKNYLRIKFGYGIFRKQFILKEIISVRIVKNHWYYGWGIRGWLQSRMLIFNVSGFDAVEIKMKNGKTYRIGTDEPEKLEYAIMQAIKR